MPWILLGVGALLGAIAGLIQLRALRESANSLVAAASAMDVRRALTSTRAGRMYVYVFWSSTVLLLVLALVARGGGGLLGWIAGACAFKALREAITLPATFELERASRGVG